MVPKQAISVTLDSANVTWLKGRAGASGLRSVSELLDTLVREARTKGTVGTTRSVVGTVDIDPNDPLLREADALVRAAFDRSLRRPMVAKERSPEYRVRRSRKKARG